jgi:hypothetical protein
MDWALDGERYVKEVTGTTEKQATIQLVARTWLRKRGDENVFKSHMVR